MNKPDFNLNPDGHRRYLVNAPLTFQRAEGDKKAARISGIASRVDVSYDMYWWKEVIQKGAFDDCLNDDVRCLFNHDPSLLLARKGPNSSTLNYYLDAQGNLAYDYETPDRSFAWDLQDMVERGDVDKSSFQFSISDYRWEMQDGEDLLVITKMKRLYDVSPVTFPASDATTTELSERSKGNGLILPEKRIYSTELAQRKFQLLR
jgi:uncharacterized protein